MKDILFQLDICWQLFEYHLKDLTEQEAFWCISDDGLNVRFANGNWTADWPETEAYSMGPPSIAWTLWHIQFWWKNALSANFKNKTLSKEEIVFPGTLQDAIIEIRNCHDEWIKILNNLTEEQCRSAEFSVWPFQGQSFIETALWLNAEFMKNVSEIGSGRFLYAVSEKNFS